MKKKLLYILFFLAPFIVWGQGENNIWTFACDGGSSFMALNFNTNPPSIDSLLVTSSGAGGAISYSTGQLRFIFRLTTNTPNYLSPEVFHPDGTPIANSDFLSGTMTDGCIPLVIPRPGNANQYYLIYSYSNGLIYSLLDMSANNGAGAVIEKDKIISPYGTVVAEKLAAVPGCNGVWIVTRSRLQNAWMSFHVTASGVDTSAVISTAGNFTSYDYGFVYFARRFKVSPDGAQIAAASWKGVELYDFEKCSGKLKNARVIDTTGNTLPFTPLLYLDHRTFADVCFSPDGSKLYATLNQKLYGIVPQPGKLYQYNLALPSLQDIIASKTLIITNQPSMFTNPVTLDCNFVVQNPLGNMRCGPDGKLYIDNGSSTCFYTTAVPPGFNPGAAFHIVNLPNAVGLACNPQLNSVLVNGTFYYGASFFYGGYGASMIQQNIVIAPPAPDTLIGNTYDAIACFTDSMLLRADSAASCYEWDNGSEESSRYIFQSGAYWVRYFKDCTVITDTFHVRMDNQLPAIKVTRQNCPGKRQGALRAYFTDNETHTFQYTWLSPDHDTIRQFTGSYGDEIDGLGAGLYSLVLRTASGCDTILYATIQDMPAPELAVTPADTTISYGDAILLRASGALSYIWSPEATLNTANLADAMARPLQPTTFTVVGSNQYGCTDTGYVNINIDYTMPVLIPNAFSPNGDGKNDLFRIEGFTYQNLKEFSVFNRYGQRVYYSIDGNKGWDGSQNGRSCEAGTYYYQIKLASPDGNQRTYKGDVTLIR